MKFGGLFSIFQFELFLTPFATLGSLFQKLNHVVKHSRWAVIETVFLSTKPSNTFEKGKISSCPVPGAMHGHQSKRGQAGENKTY